MMITFKKTLWFKSFLHFFFNIWNVTIKHADIQKKYQVSPHSLLSTKLAHGRIPIFLLFFFCINSLGKSRDIIENSVFFFKLVGTRLSRKVSRNFDCFNITRPLAVTVFWNFYSLKF